MSETFHLDKALGYAISAGFNTAESQSALDELRELKADARTDDPHSPIHAMGPCYVQERARALPALAPTDLHADVARVRELIDDATGFADSPWIHALDRIEATVREQEATIARLVKVELAAREYRGFHPCDANPHTCISTKRLDAALTRKEAKHA